MVLVDTSVWVEVFRARDRLDLEVLHRDRDSTALAEVSALHHRGL